MPSDTLAEIMPTLAGSIRVLNKIEHMIAETEALLAEQKKIKATAEEQVIDCFVMEEVDKISVDGRSYRVDVVPRIAPAAGAGDAVVAWIVDNGGADLVQPSMNAQRRNKFLRESCIDDTTGVVSVPAGLADLVTVFEQPQLKSLKS
jgi:hypothetical protein